MRVFLDSNVLIAAIATRGLCADVFEIVVQSHELLSSAEVLDEIGRVLSTKLNVPRDIAGAFVNLILDEAEKVAPGESAPELSDPDDVPILAAAQNGNADVFVTGDKALLDLQEWEGMKIVSPRQFAGLLTGD